MCIIADIITFTVNKDRVWFDKVNFVSEIEWGPFKHLFCKGNDSIVKLIISSTSGVSLCTDVY